MRNAMPLVSECDVCDFWFSANFDGAGKQNKRSEIAKDTKMRDCQIGIGFCNSVLYRNAQY